MIRLTTALVLLCTGASWGQAATAPIDTGTLPLVMLNGAPYVELQLGPARGLFLFDTGANGSAVDLDWVTREAIPYEPAGAVRVQGTTGSLRVSQGRFERLDLGSGFFLEPEFNLQDFSRFRHPAAGPQVGLLGTDFLNRYRTTLDYASNLVRLELKNQRQRLHPDRWQPLSLAYVDRLPTATIRLGGLDLPCRLDSGASYTSPGTLLDVNQACVATLEAAGRRLEERGSLVVRGASGPETRSLLGGPEGDPLELQLGRLTLRDVTLVVHSRGALATGSPLTLASASVMSRLRTLILDPFDHLLWVPRGEPASD